MLDLNIRGKTFSVSDEKVEFWKNLEAGNWEATTFDVFDEYISKTTLFVDIGGWIGPTTLYAACLTDRVISIEADPVAATLLNANINLNADLAQRITIIEKAVAPFPGTVRLGARTGRGDSMSSVLLANSNDSWEVSAITPADIAKLANGSHDLFIKIDIEGAEYGFLPEIAPLLEFDNVKCLIAFHPKFLPGWRFSRWIKTFWMTRNAFKPFRKFDVRYVKRHKIERSSIINFLNKAGLAFFPARRSWLFIKRTK